MEVWNLISHYFDYTSASATAAAKQNNSGVSLGPSIAGKWDVHW
jgi:hypothetical protein